MTRSFLFLLIPCMLFAAPDFKSERTTDRGVAIIRLTDVARQMEVSVVPSIGNRIYEFKVHGKNLLYFPTDLAQFQAAGGRAFNGVPFLAPWGNRIPGGGFWANGKRYTFNPALNNLSMQSGIAIHGMLTASPFWEVTEVSADRNSAHVTCRLPFWRYPDLMANWPFAHEYEMTYTLTAQGLEVATSIKNLSAEPMPIVIGFHPYFNIPGVPRPEWSLHIPAKQHVEMDATLVATGEMTESTLPASVSLKDRTFDDGFTNLVRNADGRATFSIQAGDQKIEVIYGPKYKVALVFAPPGREFVCFEPMAAITNAANLAHEGKYHDLQLLAPNQTWQESFWIRPSGFK